MQANYVEALLNHPGETAVLVAERHSGCVLILGDFNPKEYPGCIVVVTPMMGIYDEGAVFRLYFEFINQFTNKPIYSNDTFLNPAADSDRKIIRYLGEQVNLDFYFHNRDMAYVGSKRIRWPDATRLDIPKLMRQAAQHNATLPPPQLDFVAAKKRMMEELPIK